MSEHLHICPECGCLLGKARSVKDLRRLYAVIRRATDNWWHEHPFQPSSPEELRGYLLVKAGHIEVHRIPYPEECDSEPIRKLFRLAVESAGAALSRKATYTEYRVSASGVEVITPASISFGALDHKGYCDVRERVEHVIAEALGITAQELLEGRAA